MPGPKASGCTRLGALSPCVAHGCGPHHTPTRTTHRLIPQVAFKLIADVLGLLPVSSTTACGVGTSERMAHCVRLFDKLGT